MQIAAVYVNWNGQRFLPSLLATLAGQQGVDLHLIVVDNCSTDGSRAWLSETLGRDEAPGGAIRRISLLLEDRNLGFAEGVNHGLRLVTEEPWVVLINPDVELAPDYCLSLLTFASEHADLPIGSLTGTLRRSSGEVDSAGHLLFHGAWSRNRHEGCHDTDRVPTEVFGVCAAAGVYRTAALRSVALDDGILGRQFFAYFEDVDLDWRLRWRGWRSFHVPAANAVHLRHGSGAHHSAAVRRHLVKNYLLLVTRVMPWRWMIADVAPITALAAGTTAIHVGASPSALLGLLDYVRCLPGTVRARRDIMRGRVVSTDHLAGWRVPFPWRERIRLRVLRGLRCLLHRVNAPHASTLATPPPRD